ncbi:hypothetical protein D3C87_777270 [compost metagenome]
MLPTEAGQEMGVVDLHEAPALEVLAIEALDGGRGRQTLVEVRQDIGGLPLRLQRPEAQAGGKEANGPTDDRHADDGQEGETPVQREEIPQGGDQDQDVGDHLRGPLGEGVAHGVHVGDQARGRVPGLVAIVEVERLALQVAEKTLSQVGHGPDRDEAHHEGG